MDVKPPMLLFRERTPDTFDTIEFDTTDHIMGIAVHEYDQGNIGDLRGRWGNPYADIRMEKK